MSAAAQVKLPTELKSSSWEKDKKSGFDAKSDVADKLKALEKKHEAIDWKLFDEGWHKSARTAAELEAEGSKRDKVYRGSVFALKKDAAAVESLAKSAEKKADKPWADTLKSIAKAAGTYADDIDKGAKDLLETYERAQDALPEDDDEDSKPSALVNPQLLYKQLTMCRKDPERVMKFAFVDAKDKTQAAMLALHPRMSARSLFSKLQAAAGVKTGAYGTAWVDGMSLMLQLDKPLSGLTKKARAAAKACGFKLTKVVLWAEDGSVLEQDEDAGDEAENAAPAGAGTSTTSTTSASSPPADTAAVRYQARLKALFPGLQAALTQRLGDTAKMQKVAEFAREKAAVTQYEVALQALDALEKLLQAARQTSTAQTIEPGAPLTPIWTAAKERMDEQLSALQLAMRRFGDPGLDEIATKMADSLANYRSTLIAALMSYDRATEATREPLRQRASDVVRSYRERLATDTDVAAADDNPFKLQLDMRSTLDGALDRIAAALQQAGAQAQRAAAS